MRKAKKRENPRASLKQQPAAKRSSSQDQPPPQIEPAGMLKSPPQCAPMQREYLRSVIGKEGGAIIPGSSAPQTDGNYSIRLLTFAIGNRGF